MESILRRIKDCIVSQEKIEAKLVDTLMVQQELIPEVPTPPPEEFKKIMDQIEKRGTKTVVSQQLKLYYSRQKLISCLHKPVIIVMVVFAMFLRKFIAFVS